MTPEINLQGTKLAAKTILDNKVTIYIPSTININEVIDTTAQVNSAATLLSNCFGGATAVQSIGYWVSDTAGLVQEQTTQVYAYCDSKSLLKHADVIVDFCEELKAELRQDAIAFELNGNMRLI